MYGLLGASVLLPQTGFPEQRLETRLAIKGHHPHVVFLYASSAAAVSRTGQGRPDGLEPLPKTHISIQAKAQEEAVQDERLLLYSGRARGKNAMKVGPPLVPALSVL